MEPKTPASKWEKVAANLGLQAIRSGGIFGERTRLVVGDRGGYLLAITPGHAARKNAVEVLARFPQRMTVLGFRDDLLRHKALLAAFGRKRKLPLRRIRHIKVGDGAVLVRLPYIVFEPTRSRIERVTTGLVEALTDLIRPLDRLCESCGQPYNLGLFLADGIPAYFCDTCIDDHQRDEEALAEQLRRLEPDTGRGLGTGALAAFSLGIALGAGAAIGVILGGSLALWIALPIFALLGFGVSNVARRGFLGWSVATIFLKIPLVLLAVAVAFTAMNAVATMTLQPAIWNLMLLKASSIDAARARPVAAGLLAGAGLAGWLLESVWLIVARLKPHKRTEIERLGDVAP